MATPDPAQEQKKTKLSRLPWKPLLATLGVAGGAHLVGYMTSGAVTRGVSKIPGVAEKWNRLSPRKQHALATTAVGLSSSHARGRRQPELRARYEDRFGYHGLSGRPGEPSE